jgi:hypothetical protein
MYLVRKNLSDVDFPDLSCVELCQTYSKDERGPTLDAPVMHHHNHFISMDQWSELFFLL